MLGELHGMTRVESVYRYNPCAHVSQPSGTIWHDARRDAKAICSTTLTVTDEGVWQHSSQQRSTPEKREVAYE